MGEAGKRRVRDGEDRLAGIREESKLEKGGQARPPGSQAGSTLVGGTAVHTAP